MDDAILEIAKSLKSKRVTVFVIFLVSIFVVNVFDPAEPVRLPIEGLTLNGGQYFLLPIWHHPVVGIRKRDQLLLLFKFPC